MPKKQDTTLPVLTHILGLFTGFLGPLIILLVTQDKNSKNHAKYALNWQFSLMIYFFVSIILAFVLIGFLFLFALFVLDLIFSIMAAVRAGDNKLWQYPLAIHFFKV
jgi:hypothetical protein